MPRHIYQQPNGKWCVFSTIVDDFLLYDATRDELVTFLLKEERKRIHDLLDRTEAGDIPPRLSFEDAATKSDIDFENSTADRDNTEL